MMGEAALPPVQRRRFASERREWKQMVEIQQHLLLTSSRSSKHTASGSSSEKASHAIQKQPAGPKPKVPPATPVKPPPPEDQACSSAPALLGEQKILLHTAEVMETLSILLQSDSSVCSSSSGTDARQDLCSALKKEHVKGLHDQMKSFMKERCLLVIKKECCHQVALVRKLRDRVKNLALAEDTLIGQLLLSGHPVLPKDVLHLSFLRKSTFLDNLQAVTFAWPYLLKFLGHTFNSFDAQWHTSLDVVLRWTQVRLESLAEQALRWAWLSLRNDILLLCRMDAADLHADWIGGVFASCHFFNQLLSACGSSAGVAPLPVSTVLFTLAVHQAEVSAARLAAFVCVEGRKSREATVRSFTWGDIATAEFWSMAATRDAAGTAALLTALIQSDQTLLLKYLYAATCIDHSVPPQAVKQKQGRAHWRKQPPRAARPSCFELERLYWDHYWDCFVGELLVRLTTVNTSTEVSGPSGEPPVFDMSLLLMLACQSQDLPNTAVTSMKCVCQILLAQLSLVAWRQALNAALFDSHHGATKNVIKNLLLHAVQPLSAYLANQPVGDHKGTSLAKVYLALTLWHTFHWAEASLRSNLHSWAPPLLPQLIFCDLQPIIASAKCAQPSWDKLDDLTNLSFYANSLCDSAVEALEHLQDSVATRYQDNCYKATLKNLQVAVPTARRFHKQGRNRNDLISPILDEVLDTVIPVLVELPAPVQALYTRITLEAVFKAWKKMLVIRHLKFNEEESAQLTDVAAMCLTRVEHSDLHETAKSGLWNLSGYHDLLEFVRAAQRTVPASSAGRKLFSPNRVSPLVGASGRHAEAYASIYNDKRRPQDAQSSKFR